MSLSQEQLNFLFGKKKQQEIAKERPKKRNEILDTGKFDKAALFLLGMGFANLFEPLFTEGTRYLGDPVSFRCKGCYEENIKLTERKSHYDNHKRELITYAT